MALAFTTLAAPMTVSDLIATVTVATGFATSAVAPQFVRIDNEYSVIHPSYVSGTAIPVYRRGDQGSSVVAHNTGATVVTGLFSDMVALQSGAVAPVAIPSAIDDLVTYASAAVAIPLPTKNTTVQFNRTGGIVAATFPIPTADMDGITVTFANLQAQANTVTLPSAAFLSGLTGSPHTIWTATTGFKGQGFKVQATQGAWLVLSNIGGTFS